MMVETEFQSSEIMEQKAYRLAELMQTREPLGKDFRDKEINAVRKALYFYARSENPEQFKSLAARVENNGKLEDQLNAYVAQVAKTREITMPEDTVFFPTGIASSLA